MAVQIQIVSLEEKEILAHLLADYLKELDTQSGTETIDHFKYPFLNTYWQDNQRIPLFIKQKVRIIGFALVNEFVLDQTFAATRSIAEFYIKPTFRKNGLGKAAAIQIFTTYPEKWEIRQQVKNLPAQAFWRKVIHEFSNGHFQEKEIKTAAYHAIAQLFDNRLILPSKILLTS